MAFAFGVMKVSIHIKMKLLAHTMHYVDCNNGYMRLVGGLTDSEGTVEICRNNLWGLVSDINWGDNETRVVCRQLGFQTQG